MIVFGQTDIGSVRAENQDTFRCGKLPQGAVYGVVCDGMGGAAGGSVASRLTAELMEERIVTGYREGMTPVSCEHLLESAVAAANALVYDESMANPKLRGMGTTVAAVIVLEDTAVVAHVGDSRVYLVEKTLTQLTRDHSIVQEMIEKGQLTPEEAEHHPRKNLITRAIGVDSRVLCDLQTVEIPAESGLLLCSDGLTNMVTAADIASILLQIKSEQAPNALIKAANLAGGTDNITAVWVSPS